MDFDSRLSKKHLTENTLKFNNSGFGIAQVLIAFALLSVLVLIVSNMLSSTFQTQRGIQAKDQQRELTSRIRVVLSDKSACFNSFKGFNPTQEFSVTQIKNSSDAPVFVKGNEDPSGFVTFGNFKVGNWVADPGFPLQGTTQLRVELTKTGIVSGPKEIKPDVIYLRMKKSPTTNLLTECYAIGIKTDGFWQASPSNISDIHFPDGNVGIGTVSPAVKLDVEGSIRPGSTGIAQGAPCSSEGAFAYERNIHAPVYCNASGVWTTMGGAPTSHVDCEWIAIPGMVNGNVGEREQTCPAGKVMTGFRSYVDGDWTRTGHFKIQCCRLQ